MNNSKAIARVHLVHFINMTNVEQCQLATDPWTEPPIQNHESGCKLLVSTHHCHLAHSFY